MDTFIFQIQSTLILCILYLGVFLRRKSLKAHRNIMILAMIWDILLILQIELMRGATSKALKIAENSSLLTFHVSIAVLVVFLYGMMAITGLQRFKGIKEGTPKLHVKLGVITIILRTLVYITSYFIA